MLWGPIGLLAAPVVQEFPGFPILAGMKNSLSIWEATCSGLRKLECFSLPLFSLLAHSNQGRAALEHAPAPQLCLLAFQSHQLQITARSPASSAESKDQQQVPITFNSHEGDSADRVLIHLPSGGYSRSYSTFLKGCSSTFQIPKNVTGTCSSPEGRMQSLSFGQIILWSNLGRANVQRASLIILLMPERFWKHQ